MFHLGWFIGSGFSVQTWALDPWAGDTGHDWMKGDLFVDLAASLERARFDYLLVEDTSMVEDAYGRSTETTLKYGLLAPKCDPVPLVPLLTQRTKHIGIAVTLSTSFYHPFMAARTMTTLDHLTDGRVGLNVVTGSSTRAAQQYGYDALMLHSERYEMAREWMEAVGALWDSWEEGAVLVDEETPRATPITPRCTPSTSRGSTSGPAARSTPSPARSADRSSCRRVLRRPGMISPQSTRSRCSRTAPASCR
ncbi:MAG: FMN-dependent oxidoreductase, nitrilotriacetate monooxygenase family [Mycobacterium sp.]|nr:FMN-dependent oxidoreductase, nitrilotriacetate monooxygenase family [Mycobacterium sp.]